MNARDDAERTRIDSLIDFYERSKSNAGQRIGLALTPKQLCKLFGVLPQLSDGAREKIYPAEITHRGRVLYAKQT